jgi:hypothetical protein
MIEFKPVSMPASLTGQSNGKLTPSNLTPVLFRGVGHLSFHPVAARSWNLMSALCTADTKSTMSTTGTYRTYDQQLQLFLARYTDSYLPVRNVSTSKRTWQGKVWYLRRGYAPCATPGTSNHGWALAIDTAIARSTYDPVAKVNVTKIIPITADLPVWRWLVNNAVSFGWSWEGVRVPGNWMPGDPAPAGFEPWHLRYVAGDVVPQRILDIEAWFAAQAGTK